MTSQDTYDSLKELFYNLENLQSLSDLNNYIEAVGLSEEILHFYDKYPKFKFEIKPADILMLKEQQILDEDHKLNSLKFNGTTLEMLLVAALWKNGDINKIQHIIDGILKTDGYRTNNSLVFKQFGRSLGDSLEPVIDQHVLRAFEIFISDYSSEGIKIIRQKENYTCSDEKILNKYRAWFKNLVERISENEQLDFIEKIDKVLFLKGKSIKLKKEKR